MKTLFITVLAIALASAAPSPISMLSCIRPQLSRQSLGYEFRINHANDVDQVDSAAAPEKRQDRPAPKGNPWSPWTGDNVKRIWHPDDQVKRSDEATEGNPWTPWHGNPWTDDKEKRQHEPHAEGNPWVPWTENKE